MLRNMVANFSLNRNCVLTLAGATAKSLEKAVPFVQLMVPLYAGTQRPDRFIYPQNEINTNPNVPSPLPTQFQKIPIFQ